MVEIGRVDIITEVSLVASHMAMPREGYLDADVLHIFGYLKIKYNSRMCFDPTVHIATRRHLKNATGRSFMATLRKLFQVTMHLSLDLEVRVIIFGCTLTGITLERRELKDLALVSLSLSIKA
jgi:hypothetical protein